MRAGVSLELGDLHADGFRVEVGVLGILWGSYREPITTGLPVWVYGLDAWFDLRYQLHDLLGGAGGLFVGVTADVSLAIIDFRGPGMRGRVDGEGVVNARNDSKLDLAGSLQVGYVY